MIQKIQYYDVEALLCPIEKYSKECLERLQSEIMTHELFDAKITDRGLIIKIRKDKDEDISI